MNKEYRQLQLKNESLGGPVDALQSLLGNPDLEGSQVEMRVNLIMNEQHQGAKQKMTEAAIRLLTQDYPTYKKIKAANLTHLLGRLAGNGESKLEEKAATLANPEVGDLVTSFPNHAMEILDAEFGGDVDAAIDALEDYEGADPAAVERVLAEMRDPDFKF